MNTCGVFASSTGGGLGGRTEGSKDPETSRTPRSETLLGLAGETKPAALKPVAVEPEATGPALRPIPPGADDALRALEGTWLE